MTLDQLADLDADELEKLTPQQLEEILKPYFNITRPEIAGKRDSGKKEEQLKVYIPPHKQKALELLKEQGIDVNEFMKKKYKK